MGHANEEGVNLRKSTKIKRWQYTYSGWLRLFKCKNMTKEEEAKFHEKLWNDRIFADKIYKEYQNWQTEEE